MPWSRGCPLNGGSTVIIFLFDLFFRPVFSQLKEQNIQTFIGFDVQSGVFGRRFQNLVCRTREKVSLRFRSRKNLIFSSSIMGACRRRDFFSLKELSGASYRQAQGFFKNKKIRPPGSTHYTTCSLAK